MFTPILFTNLKLEAPIIINNYNEKGYLKINKASEISRFFAAAIKSFGLGRREKIQIKQLFNFSLCFFFFFVVKLQNFFRKKTFDMYKSNGFLKKK